ncbi:mitochondrial sodium/calcium exchanger protein [Drosophila ficusphila]|uniref:mitochondrial sodium/calcium exchanger protein n=1 Tax=Drosophila ficusphila TaxID=30025 RepID=UPI0007E82C09|nr:mitochondrial sodium/calcium exchanger protein [Drosophila ficusphila]
MEFVELSDSRCVLPKDSYRQVNLTCDLATSRTSCGLFAYFINYLELFFCLLPIPTFSIYGLISAVILLAYFCVLFMLTKYFFVPNLVTLIQFAPMTMFGISFLISGPSFFASYYISDWKVCNSPEKVLTPVQFSKIVGDILRYFLIGVMTICTQGYRAEGVTLWSCMSFILVGTGYLFAVTKKSYQVEKGNTDEHLAKFRVIVFLYIFVIVLLVIFVVSHTTYQRNSEKRKQKENIFWDMDSGDEILGKYEKQRVFTKKQIWLRTINGRKNMKDLHVIYRIIMMPIYFIASLFIPVITKDRFLVGFRKHVCCICLIVLPFIFLLHGFKAFVWIMMLLVCWLLSILVFISTHPLRRPDNVWLFALLGLITSSAVMNLFFGGIENITWQYISVHFDVMPDVVALMYFELGGMFCQVIVVRCLQLRKMWDATFGVVMSMVTYSILLAFPLLYFQGCYNPSCKLIITASTETGIHFLFLILSTSLLHISMSGYEFRLSLLFYLLTLTVFYVTIQWMVHYGWILSLATLYELKK